MSIFSDWLKRWKQKQKERLEAKLKKQIREAIWGIPDDIVDIERLGIYLAELGDTIPLPVYDLLLKRFFRLMEEKGMTVERLKKKLLAWNQEWQL